MSTLKDVYLEYYPKLIRVLPMDDAYFRANLNASRFLPGDAKAMIESRPTRADKASYFLDNFIANAFEDDGSNSMFSDLLNLMERSDDSALKSIAAQIKKKTR